jgi:thiamine biosynthesis protein ThiI
MKNAQAVLAEYPVVTMRRISGRILIFVKEGTPYETACDLALAASRIPGVARVSCGYICHQDLEEMCEAAQQALSDAEPFSTFKVQARRNHTDFPINSMELNQQIGAHLCRNFPEKGVKMKGADVEVHVEVIEGSCYIYAWTMRGVGGLPVGSSGRVMCLLSSGIDSPVAVWRLARRGAIPFGVHFSGRPQTVSTSEYLVDDIAHVLEKSGCIARVYVVLFGDYQRTIAALVPPELRIIMYRRLMFKVAEQLARQVGAKSLVTGESLGQVASQTIENMTVTEHFSEYPMMRPCCGLDKEEIIRTAEEIDTYETSILPYEDCCVLFSPRHPVLRGTTDAAEDIYKELEVDELIEKAYNEREIVKLTFDKEPEWKTRV